MVGAFQIARAGASVLKKPAAFHAGQGAAPGRHGSAPAKKHAGAAAPRKVLQAPVKPGNGAEGAFPMDDEAELRDF